MESLNDEYTVIRVRYKRQKEYRKNQERKEALAMSNRKYNIKQLIERLNKINNTPKCNVCEDSTLGFLTTSESEIICFNCKFGLTEEEIKECQ